MKARIYWVRWAESWFCHIGDGRGPIGVGDTPRDAYNNWYLVLRA